MTRRGLIAAILLTAAVCSWSSEMRPAMRRSRAAMMQRRRIARSIGIRGVAGALALVLAIVGPIGLRRASAIDPAAPSPRTVSVFAAASLTAAFRAVGTAFEAAHPGVRAEFNFAGSPTLVRQIREGAPADVFASADEVNMQALADASALAGAPRIFARNVLQIVVEKGNPHGIGSLADLARPGLVVVLCGATVPAGRYTLEAFAKAAVTPPEGSRELDVKAVVSKVGFGEADAGVVYATDVRAARDTVEGVGIAEAQNVVARYPIAALAGAAHAEAARAFVDFVLSEPGRKILADFGFLSP